MAEIITKTFKYENCESDFNIPIIMVTIIEDYYLKEKIRIAYLAYILFGQLSSSMIAYNFISEHHRDLFYAAQNYALSNSDKIIKLID